MQSLNDRIARLRKTRIALSEAIKQAWATERDPGYREQKVQAATAALRSTQADWDALMSEQEARSARVELAQLRHQTARPPVRRATPDYVRKVIR